MNKYQRKQARTPRPCPYCGSMPYVHLLGINGACFIYCDRYGCNIPINVFGMNKKGAVSYWNKYTRRKERQFKRRKNELIRGNGTNYQIFIDEIKEG